MCTPTQGVWQPAGCVSCELVCVCVSLVRVVIICLASTHTALVSSPSLTVLHLTTYIQHVHVCVCRAQRRVPDGVRPRVTREVRSGCVAAAPLAECLVLWFCVSLLCDRHRPSCVHPYRVGVPVVGRTVLFAFPSINQDSPQTLAWVVGQAWAKKPAPHRASLSVTAR